MWGVSLGCQQSSVSGITERCVFNKNRTNYTRDWFFSWSVNERFRRELRFSWRCLLAYTYSAMNRMSATAMAIVKMVITTTSQYHSRYLTCGPESLNLIHPHTLSGIMEVIKRLGNTIIYSLYTSRTITNRNICVWGHADLLLDEIPLIRATDNTGVLPINMTDSSEHFTSHPDTSHWISCHNCRWCTATILTPRCVPTHSRFFPCS